MTKPSYEELENELEQFRNLTYVRNFECREAILKAELAHQKANVAEMYRDCMKAESRVRELESLPTEWEGSGYSPQQMGRLVLQYRERQSDVRTLSAELARVRGLLQRQWVSVEERLPELKDGVSKHVIITVRSPWSDKLFTQSAYYEESRKLWHGTISWDKEVICWQPFPEPATFPQSPELVPSGAESADIGKLDAADKKMCKCGHSDEEHDDGRLCCTHRKSASLFCSCNQFEGNEEGVEIGKVNRVDDTGCPAISGGVKCTLDVGHAGDHRAGDSFRWQGSAETGGEKA